MATRLLDFPTLVLRRGREFECGKAGRRFGRLGHVRLGRAWVSCCCSDPVVPARKTKSAEKADETWRFDPQKVVPPAHRVRVHATPSMPFASPQYVVSFFKLLFDVDRMVVYKLRFMEKD